MCISFSFFLLFFYRSANKSLARPGRKQANDSVRMARISFSAFPCGKNNLMTACVSMLLKSRASLTCFQACFLPGRAKGLSSPRYIFLYEQKSIPLEKDHSILFSSHPLHIFGQPSGNYMKIHIPITYCTNCNCT